MSGETINCVSPEFTNYNSFFHPNYCHVCKKTCPDLETCPECRMISYCSAKHRMLHRQQHKEICQAIVNTNACTNIWDSCNLEQEEWIKFKRKNMHILKQVLNRKMEPYEEQMFLFAKSCFVCRSQLNLITICKLCASINKCVDHISVRNEHNCQKLVQAISFDHCNAGIQKDSIPEIFLSISINNYYDMYSVICNGLYANVDKCLYIPSIEDYIRTDKLSRPLTVFHGMRDANLLNFFYEQRKIFIVHIIDGSFIDAQSISAWEVILHEFFPEMTLLISMVESHLQEKYEVVQVCRTCTEQGKIFQCDCYSMFYYNFINLWHQDPDVIVAFDTDFANDDISLRTIKALQLKKCPVLLTAKSEEKAEKIVTKIQEVLKFPFRPIINKKNRFVSGRLYRNYENDSVYFPNQYLIVYRNLVNQ